MIFIDRSIPKGVANALKAVRDDVKWLEDEFAHDARDTVWLPRVGARGWLWSNSSLTPPVPSCMGWIVRVGSSA